MSDADDVISSITNHHNAINDALRGPNTNEQCRYYIASVIREFAKEAHAASAARALHVYAYEAMVRWGDALHALDAGKRPARLDSAPMYDDDRSFEEEEETKAYRASNRVVQEARAIRDSENRSARAQLAMKYALKAWCALEDDANAYAKALHEVRRAAASWFLADARRKQLCAVLQAYGAEYDAASRRVEFGAARADAPRTVEDFEKIRADAIDESELAGWRDALLEYESVCLISESAACVPEDPSMLEYVMVNPRALQVYVLSKELARGVFGAVFATEQGDFVIKVLFGANGPRQAERDVVAGRDEFESERRTGSRSRTLAALASLKATTESRSNCALAMDEMRMFQEVLCTIQSKYALFPRVPSGDAQNPRSGSLNVERKSDHKHLRALPWMAMERVGGGTLHAQMQHGFEFADVARVTVQCLWAVWELLRLGYTHNDLHTGNVMFRAPMENPLCRVVIVDFGFATPVDPTEKAWSGNYSVRSKYYVQNQDAHGWSYICVLSDAEAVLYNALACFDDDAYDWLADKDFKRQDEADFQRTLKQRLKPEAWPFVELASRVREKNVPACVVPSEEDWTKLCTELLVATHTGTKLEDALETPIRLPLFQPLQPLQPNPKRACVACGRSTTQ